MMEVARQKVIQTYRNLLKQQLFTFKNDHQTLEAARRFTRQQYNLNKDLTNSSEIHSLIEQAESAVKYLRSNIVQAVQHHKNQVFELKLDPSVHELNDNTDVKKPYVKQKRQPCIPPPPPPL